MQKPVPETLSEAEWTAKLTDFMALKFLFTPDMTREWIEGPKVGLGGTSPKKLIENNRGHKVFEYIEAIANGY